MSSCCPVPTLAAVTRVPVLRPRIPQTVAVDVAEVPLLARLDALVAAGAVNDTLCHQRS